MGNEITKEKATKFFVDLDEESLEKGITYCCGNTYYSSWGIDECYYCTIIKFVNEEFRTREKLRARMELRYFLFIYYFYYLHMYFIPVFLV